jgi:catechol 2,3-dioxygenase-like lactoylglutathione lyase family enzyme
MDTFPLNLRAAVVELVVADMAATVDFYRHLGLVIPAGAEAAPHVDVDLGGVHLAFDTREVVLASEPGWTPPSGGHRIALAFAAGSPEQVDLAYAALVGSGAAGQRAPWDAFWGMRYAVVHDPDGNPVDLFAPLPSSV